MSLVTLFIITTFYITVDPDYNSLNLRSSCMLISLFVVLDKIPFK